MTATACISALLVAPRSCCQSLWSWEQINAFMALSRGESRGFLLLLLEPWVEHQKHFNRRLGSGGLRFVWWKIVKSCRACPYFDVLTHSLDCILSKYKGGPIKITIFLHLSNRSLHCRGRGVDTTGQWAAGMRGWGHIGIRDE